MGLEVIAGSIATIVFASSTMPMLLKAWQTKDVKSYSLLNIILANIGNLFYTIYVLHLPLGPVWALHLFHCGSTGLMLYWYVRYVLLSGPRRRSLASPGEPAEPVLVEGPEDAHQPAASSSPSPIGDIGTPSTRGAPAVRVAAVQGCPPTGRPPEHDPSPRQSCDPPGGSP